MQNYAKDITRILPKCYKVIATPFCHRIAISVLYTVDSGDSKTNLTNHIRNLTSIGCILGVELRPTVQPLVTRSKGTDVVNLLKPAGQESILETGGTHQR